ncbi:RDD family protein [Saccharicrinis sp. GN24d3]|uniref:RDD family protein n=1 Tax=Saccharicrinis sp. GN24d3 TaxID=3458416 RepID=UPI0040365E20
MEYVSVSTTQNIDLEYRMAGIGDRILAFGFDLLVLSSWAILWLIVFSQTGGLQLWQIIFVLPIMFYSLLSELFLNGQTFGKMVLKIRVAKLDGSELTLGTCLIRWIMRIIDIWLLSGAVAVLAILVSNKSQRLGDLATGTSVVKTSHKNLFEETTYIEVPKDYTTVYPQSSRLSDEDAATIKEVLNFVEAKNDTGTDVEYHPMQLKLQNALKQKLEIRDINGSAKTFLEDLLKDFNHLHR